MGELVYKVLDSAGKPLGAGMHSYTHSAKIWLNVNNLKRAFANRFNYWFKWSNHEQASAALDSLTVVEYELVERSRQPARAYYDPPASNRK